MGIKIEKAFQVQEPAPVVWAFLSDIRKVVTCVPGAEITDQVGEDRYTGSVKVKVGPAVTDFKGEVQVLRVDPAAHTIEILAKGKDVKGKGNASMKMTGNLRVLPEGGTEVTSVSEVNIVGILAQMGGRVINEVSNIMFEKFTQNFREKLEQEREAESDAQTQSATGPKPINALSVGFSAVKAAMKRKKVSETADSKPDDKASDAEEEPQQKIQ